MNREIKFKCYTKSDRDGSISMQIHKVTLMEYSVSAVSSQSTFSKIIGYCQYTGLKDKNGVEIYEGDIWSRNGFIGEIVFNYSQWEIRTISSSPSYQYPYFHSNASRGEVIGNIYEHPELIGTAATLEGGQQQP